MISARSFRNTRQRVLSKILDPIGFVKQKSRYYRRTGTQIHMIGFQTSKWGHEYTINLAVHFVFLASLSDYKKREWNAFCTSSDFVFYARLGKFLNITPSDVWWPYGASVENAREQVLWQADKCAAILDDFEKKWRSPSTFLKRVPPRVLKETMWLPAGKAPKKSSVFWDFAAPSDVRRRGKFIEVKRPAVWNLFPHWEPEVLKMSYLLCAIASRENKPALAEEYATIALSDPRADAIDRAAFGKLLRRS